MNRRFSIQIACLACMVATFCVPATTASQPALTKEGDAQRRPILKGEDKTHAQNSGTPKGTARRESVAASASGAKPYTHVWGDPHVDQKDGTKWDKKAATTPASAPRASAKDNKSPRDAHSGQSTGKQQSPK